MEKIKKKPNPKKNQSKKASIGREEGDSSSPDSLSSPKVRFPFDFSL